MILTKMLEFWCRFLKMEFFTKMDSTKNTDFDTLQPLLKCFDYLKPYYIDTLDVIGVMLEMILLKIKKPKQCSNLLSSANKTKTSNKLLEVLKNALKEPKYTTLLLTQESKINPIKILRFIEQSHISKISNELIEEFLHLITQKKTSNKLYFYSTPSEINRLLVGILDIKDNDEVYNPCYGMGSVFLCLPSKKIKLYGEELDSKLSYLARLIASISGIEETHLGVGDILENPLFRVQKNTQGTKQNTAQNKNSTTDSQDFDFMKFDKILCNPPLNAQMSTENLKDDMRFREMGILAKSYPELVFLVHSLAHLKQKGVFIVRNQTLLKSSLEGKLRSYLCQNGLIESIIELPKNIFPHQNYDFSVIVISKGNKEILHINANNEHFFAKDGKYNRLKNIERLLEIYRYKKLTPHSALTPLEKISPKDLRAQSYINLRLVPPTPLPITAKTKKLAKDFSLQDLGVEIFRGQRVQGTSQDEPIEFYDIGIADFAICGFTQSFEAKKDKGNATKIYKYRIKPYDILLSLRGVSPKIAIVGQNAFAKKEVLQKDGVSISSINMIPSVVNAGIIVLRAPSKQVAIGLYCYFFSTQGEEALSRLYKTSTDGAIDTQSLHSLRVPSDYDKGSMDKIARLDNAKERIYAIEWEIQGIKDGK